MLEFDAMQNAGFMVSLVSVSGQVIEQKQVVLSGSNQIRLDLKHQPATGLYYLKGRRPNAQSTIYYQDIDQIMIDP